MPDEKNDSNEARVFYVRDPRPDHRTLFTLAEVEAAYRKILPEADAVEAAHETMDGPIVPGQPGLFPDGILELLSELSEDVARRVRIAEGRS